MTERPGDGDDHADAGVFPWVALIGAAVGVAVLFAAIVGGVL